MLSLISLVVYGSLNGPTLGHFVVHYVFSVQLQFYFSITEVKRHQQ